MSEPTVDRDPFEVVAESFLARFRAGERPSIEELAARHPDLADQIRELLPALVMVEQDLSIDRDSCGPQPRPSASSGKEWRLGDYRIFREIGRGGMGVVYEAEQLSLGRRVALKVLPSHVAGDVKALERFRREAKSAARLHHTNIVPVFEVGRDGEVAYFAMQFIQGQGLDQIINELARLRDPEREPKRVQCTVPTAVAVATSAGPSPFSPIAESLLSGRFAIRRITPSSDAQSSRTTEPFARDEFHRLDVVHPGPRPTEPDSTVAPGPSAVLLGGSQGSSAYLSGRRSRFFRSVAQIGFQAAQGLAHAHASGIFHRDVKPSNLLLDHAGVVWIADFGLAKGEDEGLTHVGDILGTLRYMAPERFRGEGDARADVYALGLTLYELLTLRPGFDSPDRLELIERIKTEEPKKPRAIDARIPRDLETIVLKAIEKDPNVRYQSAEAMGEDLRRFLADEPILARQVRASERYWRWARRNPTIAVLGGVLTVLLATVTVGSLMAARRFAIQAEAQSNLAIAEKSARQEADQAREAAQAESYRAVLSQVKGLRAGHPLGWRDEALDGLARLAVMPTPARDLGDLRNEAVATLGTLDIRLETEVRLPLGDLRSFTLSPDGRTLLTAGFARGLDFWDIHGQRHLTAVHTLSVPDIYEKTLIAYLPGAREMAISTRDHGVVFMDEHGIRTARAPITRGSSQPTKLAIDAQGRWIAVAWAEPNEITVHDMASGTLVGRFATSAFSLSPDSRWLARTEEGTIVLQPLGSNGPGVKLGQHKSITSFAFSGDGSMLAAASGDRTTTIWDVERRQLFGTLHGHRGPVNDVAFSPDGGAIATASGDYTARIWDTQTGRELATIPSSAWMRQVEWSSDGEHVAAITDSNQTVFLYRIAGRRQVRRLRGHGSEILRVTAHPNLERLAAVYTELIAWNLSDPRLTPHRLGPELGQGSSLAYSPSGSLLATGGWNNSSSRNCRIVVRNADTGEIRTRFSTPEVAYSLAFDATEQRLASGDVIGNVFVWDLQSSRPICRFGMSGAVFSVAFLDGGRRLLTHGANAVFLCNLDAGQVERRVILQGGVRTFVNDFARQRVVVAGQSGAIVSVSLPSLEVGHRLENTHKGIIVSLALSPDGRLLATGGEDHHVVLRDPLSFEPLLSFPKWNGSVRNLAFDASSRRLAIVGSDPDVELWEIASLSDDLAAIGLHWDRPATAAVSTAGITRGQPWTSSAVVVLSPGNTTSEAESQKQ